MVVYCSILFPFSLVEVSRFEVPLMFKVMTYEGTYDLLE